MAWEDFRHVQLTGRVIQSAIEVHRALGPGLLESAYRTCLAYELREAGMSFRQEHPIPVRYRSTSLDCGYRADLMIEDVLLVELKSVERLLPIHDAQLLTYLKLSGLHLGLLINFNAVPLRRGIRRLIR